MHVLRCIQSHMSDMQSLTQCNNLKTHLQEQKQGNNIKTKGSRL
jgi:hypothetical protein